MKINGGLVGGARGVEISGQLTANHLNTPIFLRSKKYTYLQYPFFIVKKVICPQKLV